MDKVFILLLIVVNASKYVRVGKPCTTDDDCLAAFELCDANLCRHKDSWPLVPQEWFGVFWVAFWVFVNTATGCNGGGSLVNFTCSIFGFGGKDAIRISNSSIGVASIVMYLFVFWKKHPTKKDCEGKPTGLMVDYNIAMVVTPMTIIGVAVGPIFLNVWNDTIELAFLTANLVYLFVFTAVTYRSLGRNAQIVVETPIESETMQNLKTKDLPD